jgi:hypothetical protein
MICVYQMLLTVLFATRAMLSYPIVWETRRGKMPIAGNEGRSSSQRSQVRMAQAFFILNLLRPYFMAFLNISEVVDASNEEIV